MVDRTIIADDHPLFREGLRRIAQRVVTGQIIEVSDTNSLLMEAEKKPTPKMMLLDLVFPGFGGASTIAELRNKYPQTALIVVSMTDELETAEKIMAAGANGFISKSIFADEMVEAIGRIVEGDLVICLDNKAGEVSKTLNIIDELPQRHVDVLIRIAQGKTNKEIARELGISPFTVRSHISAMFKTMGVSTRSAASAMAVSHGLI